MSITRSSLTIALVAPAFVGGCFALFSLDEYGPNGGTDDGGATDGTGGEGGTPGEAGQPGEAGAGSARIVFVTSQRFTGSLGGIAGADSRCNALAVDAGLPGTYVAWLGDGTNGPAARIPNPTQRIVMPNDEVVAGGLADLGTNGPRARILVTEKKTPLAALACTEAHVWTNARGNGSVGDGGGDCSSWSNVLAMGATGRLGGLGEEWTNGCPSEECAEPAHLYCFQK